MIPIRVHERNTAIPLSQLQRQRYYTGDVRKETLHVMVDIETAATTTDAAILEIAAVAVLFDKSGQPIPPAAKALVIPSLASQTTFDGRCVSKGTAAWHKENDTGCFARSENSTLDLASALGSMDAWFGEWMDSAQIELNKALPPRIVFWSRGVAFDFGVLEHAYKQCGMQVPWKYHELACLRTLMMFADKTTTADSAMTHTKVVAHTALQDANQQMEDLLQALKGL